MSPWQSLPTRNESAPPLLYSFTYTTKFYEFHLTDLTYIWREHLEYKYILQKAEDRETSIDPSEDANQYGVFMQKIQDALSGAKSSTVNVAPGDKPGSLLVITRTDLPGGLRPLEWSFSLSREPPSAVTQQLLLPLLKSEREREKREKSLLELLKDKDNVLFKIFDKIDPSQLTAMFPGTAGARHAKPKTSDLIRHIKGATKFDEKEWRGNFQYEHAIASDAERFVESLSEINTSGPWWENLNDNEMTSKSSNRLQKDASRKELPSAIDKKIERQDALDEDKSTEDEDEFQRQETPPHLKRTKEATVKKPAYENKSDEMAGTTESDQADDEDDDDEGRVQPPVQQERPPKKTMGRIGGPKAIPLRRPRKESISSTDSDADPELQKPQQRATTAQKVPRFDPGFSSDSQSESISASKSLGHEKGKPVEITTTKQKGVLGRIGGKKPEPRKVSPENPDHDTETQSSSGDDDLQHRPHHAAKPLPGPKKTKKLGLIGGGKKKPQPAVTPSPEHDSDDGDLGARPSKKQPAKERLPSSSPPPGLPPKSPSRVPRRHVPKHEPESEPEPELTAEQKANQKREELKRQLDARSKAPAKKKRKF